MKISIIIPVYNAEKYLKRLFDSILKQTYNNIEIIAIDDGSKDKSYEVMKEYYNNNKNIFKIFKQENKGIAYTRNKGINLATGKYLMFVDCDDWIEKDYLEVFLENAEREAADIVVGGYKRVKLLNNDKYKTMYTKKMKNMSYIYIQLAPWAKLYKREFLLENDITFLDWPVGEDIFFNCIAYNRTSKIKIINYVGYNWFYNILSVSNTVQREAKDNVSIPSLLKKINDTIQNKYLNKELYNYFLIRISVWYILFTIRTTKGTVIINKTNELFEFLENNNISFKNKYLSIFNKNSDEFKTRVLLNLFLVMKKIRVLNFFLRLFAKKS